MKTSLSLIFLIVAIILILISAFVADPPNARIFRIGMAFFAASFVAW